MNRIASLIALALAVPSAASALPSIDAPLRTGAQSPTDAAVVIGIEDYAFVADVPFAKRDAEAVASWLTYTRGVPAARLQHLKGANREQILAALERATEQVEPGGTLWIYFSGHGAASSHDAGRLLLGDDVKADEVVFESRGLPLAELERIAASSEAARVVIVLDTCYGGVDRQGAELLPGKRFLVPAARVAADTRVTVWSATSGNELSGPLDEAEHGMFTYLALGALRGWADGELSGERDGRVSLGEAQQYVRRSLAEVGEYDQNPTSEDRPELLDWVMVEGANEPAPTLGEERAAATIEPTREASASRTTSQRDKKGFAFGVGLGLPVSLRVGYELGRAAPITALGVRGGVTAAYAPEGNLVLPGFPVGAYGDLKLAETWDLELNAGVWSGLAVQYDPPASVQVQVGAQTLVPGYFYKNPIIGLSPDIAVEWVW